MHIGSLQIPRCIVIQRVLIKYAYWNFQEQICILAVPIYMLTFISSIYTGCSNIYIERVTTLEPIYTPYPIGKIALESVVRLLAAHASVSSSTADWILALTLQYT